MKLAIYAITLNGTAQAKKLGKALPFVDLFIAPVGMTNVVHNQDVESHFQELTLPLSSFIVDKFHNYDGHIFICATGIVSRIIAPLIADKRIDPAVVCLDEQANFSIAMLSGHRGGANQLTQRVAHIVKATAVVTTASDVSESLSVDMMGAPFGWYLDPITESAITPVSAAVVNEKPVAIVQAMGDTHWWKYDKRMPNHLICHDQLKDIDPDYFSAVVMVTDERDPIINHWENKLVLWRPKSLVLGIGCDRDTPLTVINAGLEAFSQEHSLSLNCVADITSIDLKANEVGLLELSAQRQWPFITYCASELDDIQGIENPSEYVKKVTGSNSVSEAAALKKAKSKKLLVAKWVFKQQGFNMTISCCRKTFNEPLKQQKRKNWYGSALHGSSEKFGISSSTEAPIINAHGNEVVAGYQCKPAHVDLNRPMLFYRQHIMLCEGARCAKLSSKNLAHDLRSILKDMGLSNGDRRIKISRSQCMGACRNKATLVIYQREPTPTSMHNNGVWMRNIETLSEQDWRSIFTALTEDNSLHSVLDKQYFASVEAPIKEFI
jgi:cobalt-precorrin 5A hydrolase